ncbi:RNA-binding cell elongation regulator Jag/EloR [Bacillus sp. FJAT-47783]|uniref:RNA-binding cell elongation regulator Jag/EloR n=1 Tax=Bacillus sp. FJAT-47783 TaxID=2922712 RepID=UPI001FAC9F69
MREITSTGSTVDEAVNSALEKLKVTKDEVEVRVIDEGKKGFLGIFGQKPAIVNVKLVKEDVAAEEFNPLKETVSELFPKSSETAAIQEEIEVDPVDEAKIFLKKVLKNMGVEAFIHVKRDKKTIHFNMEGEKLAILIGKRGQTLNSLQLLTQLVVNRYSKEYVQVVLDAENYRKRREETLIQLAKKLANKAVKMNQEVSLEPMPSFERKIIHSALVNDNRVETYSEGTDPHRYIVIAPIRS